MKLVIEVVFDDAWLEAHKHKIVGVVEDYCEERLPDSITDADDFDVADHVEWDMEEN